MQVRNILICGGRDFSDAVFFDRAMRWFTDVYGMPQTVTHGCARGADAMGAAWCRARLLDERRYPADWETHGRAAGHIRNAQMLSEEDIDFVIAFPGGRGTASMVQKARTAGVPVYDAGHALILQPHPTGE